jgi:hypothetical protein
MHGVQPVSYHGKASLRLLEEYRRARAYYDSVTLFEKSSVQGRAFFLVARRCVQKVPIVHFEAQWLVAKCVGSGDSAGLLPARIWQSDAREVHPVYMYSQDMGLL